MQIEFKLFRRENLFCGKSLGRKHGPVPFGAARETVPCVRLYAAALGRALEQPVYGFANPNALRSRRGESQALRTAEVTNCKTA